MRFHSAITLLSGIFAFSSISGFAQEINLSSASAQVEQKFTPFTGKITRSKVRLRLQPSLEGTIIRELGKGELLLVIGEDDDFYLVQPPQDIKAYVFRTYVLDNVVEGKHVNVRLYPDLEAPVLGQLNQGDSIEGTISPLNSKWLEIHPPKNSKFYVCKEFIEKIGPEGKLAETQKRGKDVQALFEISEEMSHVELQKPFTEIHIQQSVDNLNKIVQYYSDFPEYVAKAKELLNFIKDSYLQKKIAYLEAKTQATTLSSAASPESLAVQPLQIVSTPEPEKNLPLLNGRLSPWIPIEKSYYETWSQKRHSGSIEDFYKEQLDGGVIMTGIIEPYIRNIRNKPGDYILVAKNTRLPHAYLYSTKVDLASKIGKEVTLIAAPRPNNNFAHPAYFVLSLDALN